MSYGDIDHEFERAGPADGVQSWRAPEFGELVQLDGSDHPWLRADRPRLNANGERILDVMA